METQFDSEKLSALQEIAEKSTEAIFIGDLVDKKVLFANRAALTMLEVRTEDKLNKVLTMIDLVDPADRDYVMSKYREVIKSKALSGIEFRLLKPGRKTTWLSCKIVIIDNDRFIWAVIRDVTKEKEHESYLVEYGTRKNTLLDTVLHELNGALGLMNNLAQRADKLTVGSDQADLKSFISLVQSNSQHCIQIIDEMVRDEYADSPGIQVKFSRVDVVKLLTYIFEEFKKSNGNHKLVLEITTPEIFINTDDFKLSQIINNLASNARKFTHHGDEIRISLRETLNTVVISVADTGIGIPKTLQPFLFEKYGPARRSGLKGERSIGLGLFICNHLTQLLGGKLWFESKEGKGSTFYIELPKD